MPDPTIPADLLDKLARAEMNHDNRDYRYDGDEDESAAPPAVAPHPVGSTIQFTQEFADDWGWAMQGGDTGEAPTDA